MHVILLISKYLRRKLAPMFAALAVTLCTAMVIIVISVMGGFLNMMRNAARTMTGDVVVRASLTGFPHYEELIQRLQALPQVAATAPVIRSFGLLDIRGEIQPVQVEGIDPARLETVTPFRDKIHWTTEHLIRDLEEARRAVDPSDRLTLAEYDARIARLRRSDFRDYAVSMQAPPQWGDLPAAVPGIAISPFNLRDAEGDYQLGGSLVSVAVTLTLPQISRSGQPVDSALQRFVVVNEFKSGLYEIDANRFYVPMAVMQKMLRMDAYAEHDPETGEPTGRQIPARASEVVVRGKAGVPLADIEDAVRREVDRFRQDHDDVGFLAVHTWEQLHATFLSAVAKEKGLVTTLFGIISIVAVAMIGVIFYMIVLEKTRDIGILRAIGASRLSITGIFLGYGLAIGVVGAHLGLALATLVVRNINEIQDFLTRAFGLTIWDKRIYYFDRIPSQLDLTEVGLIVLVAILSSVVGSVVPAFLAGRVDPVESLRYE